MQQCKYRPSVFTSIVSLNHDGATVKLSGRRQAKILRPPRNPALTGCHVSKKDSFYDTVVFRGSAFALIATAVLCVTASAYWPGLAGSFLFDDYVNLNALGRYGGVRDLQSLLFYLTSGIADPTGRPVAMASFLLDARSWPAAPLPFKRTNLLIHLANGILLYTVLAALGRRASQDSKRARVVALLAATLWLVNPLWISTVLYVVQRHAMLAALFVLAGIRTWIFSRDAFDNNHPVRGWSLAILAIPFFGTLAGLSKANGFLLPLLLAVLELTVLRPSPTHGQRQKYASLLLIWIPSTLLISGLLWYALSIGLDGTHGRPWTLGQRLLTQPRVLCSYIWNIYVPSLNATGVFADGYAASKNWRTPWATLPALLAIGTITIGAWKLRRRKPILAAAIGFFLIGHAMESSVIMLELYFEHRNYLPATLLFWPLAWLLTTPGNLKRWLFTGAIAYASLMLIITANQARLWADPLALALVWAEQNPDSVRAQVYASQQERLAGRHINAEQRLASQLQLRPLEPQLVLNLLDLRCEQRRISQVDVERTATAIRVSGGLTQDVTYHWISSTLLPDAGAACTTLTDTNLALLVRAATDTAYSPEPEDPEMRSRAKRLAGQLALRQNHCAAALQAFNHRATVQPRPEFVQSQVLLLAARCGPNHALIHLEHYLVAEAPIYRAASPMLRLRDRLMKGWWDSHWDELRRTLASEAKPPN